MKLRSVSGPRPLSSEPIAAAPPPDPTGALYRAMVDAVLGGEGLGRVAEIAAEGAGAPVAIVLPEIGALAAAPHDVLADADAGALRRYVRERMEGRPAEVPRFVARQVPIATGGRDLGVVALLRGPGTTPAAGACLSQAAVATLVEVALGEAREAGEGRPFLAELRSEERIEDAEILRRGRRLGCDLSHGAVALCAELTTTRPRQLGALIAAEWPGALTQIIEARMFALLPAGAGNEDSGAVIAAARALAERVRRQCPVGSSSLYTEVSSLGLALQEAELVLEVLQRSDAKLVEKVSGSSSYRLLFRVLASHPEEVRAFFEDTVAPLVRYDAEYRTDLLRTLDTYLDHNCNTNATAAAIYAHRHTVGYRLERVKELSGLDPASSEDRERLSLGLKAFRILSPDLPR